MNKKLISKVISKNLFFLFLSGLATLTFMMQVTSALHIIKDGGTINCIGYTLFRMKIEITGQTYSHIYTIDNYPLIPIFAGLIYNIYILIKNYLKNSNSEINKHLE